MVKFRARRESTRIPREPGSVASPELVTACGDDLFANLRPEFSIEPSRYLTGYPFLLAVRGFTVSKGWLAGAIEIRSLFSGVAAPLPVKP